MDNYLNEATRRPDTLKNIHSILLDTCMECFQAASIYFNEDAETRTSKAAQLKMDLNTTFITTVEKSNEAKLKEALSELEALVQKLEAEYRKKVDACSRIHSNQIEVQILMDDHDKITSNVFSTLEQTMKRKIEGGGSYLSDLKQSLQSQIDFYWKELLEKRAEPNEPEKTGRLSGELKSLDSPRKPKMEENCDENQNLLDKVP